MFRRYVFPIFLLVVWLAGAASAQQSLTPNFRFTIVPLTVDQGFPLQVILTNKLHFKLHEPVRGRIVEPVYAFDREVIPPGAEVLGSITGFKPGKKLKRLTSMLGGDFTPVREPQITFDTLVLDDGTQLPIETAVGIGVDTLVRFNGDTKENAALKPHSAGAGAGHIQAFAEVGKQSGNELLKGMLWNLAPYHPQSLPAGIRYKVTLLKPVEFGNAIVNTGALDRIGSEPPSGSTIYARLETPVNSRTAKVGTPVKALLTNPLFSWDHMVIFPVGSRLTGEVVQVRRAGLLQHTGELAFKFTKLETPVSISILSSAKLTAQNVDGRLLGVQVANEMSHARIDQEGVTSIALSKMRFASPALALFNMSRGFNTGTETFGQAFTGAYTGSLVSRLLVGDAGLGVPAGIAGRMVPPVGIGLGIFGAARSVFVNILARGQEVDYPLDTPIEIRLDAKPQSSSGQ